MNRILSLLWLITRKLGIGNLMSDELYLKCHYRIRTGKKLNLKNPQRFNEKLQWLKLHDHNPLYTTMVDKYEVKGYVTSRIGEKYVIPCLGVWDHFEVIDFHTLPDQFVLKCTHDSGGLIICTDKASFDVEQARRKINKSLHRDYYKYSREWPYKNVKPRIIVEQYMVDTETNELRDYKFFCFNGTPKLLFVASERQKKGEETKFDFFDMDFQHLPIKNGHPNAEHAPEKPKGFEEMKKLAKILSEGIPMVRVDFYEVDGRVFFGEMTFSHWSGTMPFEPDEWDYTLGSWISLPVISD